MTLLAYDGASPFNLTSAKSHSGVLCTGYLVGHPGGYDPITKARVNEIRRAGMGFLPNWERSATWGRTASSADAFNAGKEALAACLTLGIPAGTAVPFSFDYQIPTSGYARCAALLAQCTRGMGGKYQAIAYGQYGFLAYLAAHGQPGPHWLMGSTWGPSDDFTPSQVSQPFVGLVQSHDAQGRWLATQVGGTDVNTLIHPETLAAWWPDNSPYGDDMPLTDADVQKIAEAVWAQKLTRTDPFTRKPVTAVASTFLTVAWADAVTNNKALNDAKTGLMVRVAALQKAITALPTQTAVVDVAAIASDVTSRVKANLAAIFGGNA